MKKLSPEGKIFLAVILALLLIAGAFWYVVFQIVEHFVLKYW